MNGCILHDWLRPSRGTISGNPDFTVRKITLQIGFPHRELSVDDWFYPIFLLNQCNKISQTFFKRLHRLYCRHNLYINHRNDIPPLEVYRLLEVLELQCWVFVRTVIVIRTHYEALFLSLFVVLLVSSVHVCSNGRSQDYEFYRILCLLLGLNFCPIDIPIVLRNIYPKCKAIFFLPITRHDGEDCNHN